jgi:hypothetical protein
MIWLYKISAVVLTGATAAEFWTSVKTAWTGTAERNPHLLGKEADPKYISTRLTLSLWALMNLIVCLAGVAYAFSS